MNCERCEKRQGHLITLTGGRDAELCTDCSAKWHRHVHGNRAWMESIRLTAVQNTLASRTLAGTASSMDDWLAYHNDYEANREVLFALADTWLREVREPAKKPQAASKGEDDLIAHPCSRLPRKREPLDCGESQGQQARGPRSA